MNALSCGDEPQQFETVGGPRVIAEELDQVYRTEYVAWCGRHGWVRINAETYEGLDRL